MVDAVPYIGMAIVALAIIAGLLFLVKKKKPEPMSPLTNLAFIFVLFGSIGSTVLENRFIGYGLIGIGVVIALIDMYQKMKKKK